MVATMERPTTKEAETNGVYLSAEYPNPTPPNTDPPPPPKAPTAPVPVLDRAAAQVARVADKGDSRPVLAGVSIRNGEAAATDGFMLAVCPLATRSPDDYGSGYAPVDPDGLLLPARVVEHFGKAHRLRDNLTSPGYMRFGGTIPITGRSADDASVTLAAPSTVEYFGNTTTETRSICGTFPDYDAIFLGGEPVASFTLDANLVMTIMQMYVAARKATGSRGEHRNSVPVSFHYYGPQNGIVFAGLIDKDRKLDAMAMPMLVEGKGHTPPRVGTGKVPKPRKQAPLDGTSVVIEQSEPADGEDGS